MTTPYPPDSRLPDMDGIWASANDSPQSHSIHYKEARLKSKAFIFSAVLGLRCVYECPHWSLPDMHQSCLMPKDCVVSEWGPWGPCSKTCADPIVPKGTRTRTRQVQQLPAGGGLECPLLEDTQPCEPLGDSVPPCATYTWRTTEWGECRVDALLSQQDRRRGNQTGLCGGGLQTREVYCVQANAELLSYLSNSQDKAGKAPDLITWCSGGLPSTTNQPSHVIQCPREITSLVHPYGVCILLIGWVEASILLKT
ncbi:hypothetical protein NFI96_007051 [Prochilodus magdalenae]|nr:hypothetical protein NFI96_007051 [Prochilodus magdalenae]